MKSTTIVALFSICGLAATLSSRSIDPLITLISDDFGVTQSTAALVTSLYALPFALGQPVLGPIGDTFGKVRMLKIYLWILAGALAASSVAPSFPALLSFRFLSGLAAGGVIPACMASLGDRYSGPERTLAMSRFVSVGLIAQIVGASLSGLVAAMLGWRTVLILASAIAASSATCATLFLSVPKAPRQSFNLRTAASNYLSVFRNPRAPLCFSTVFLEGLALFGIMPFVVGVLRARGVGETAQGGMIIGCLGIGGIAYTLLLPVLLNRVSKYTLLGIGGLLASMAPISLIVMPHWWLIATGFVVGGFGYMLMHNCIQSESVELAPNSRVSAYSMHAFSFFTGQSLGPIFMGTVLRGFGYDTMLLASAAILVLTGPAIAFGFIRLSKQARVEASL